MHSKSERRRRGSCTRQLPPTSHVHQSLTFLSTNQVTKYNSTYLLLHCITATLRHASPYAARLSLHVEEITSKVTVRMNCTSCAYHIFLSAANPVFCLVIAFLQHSSPTYLFDPCVHILQDLITNPIYKQWFSSTH